MFEIGNMVRIVEANLIFSKWDTLAKDMGAENWKMNEVLKNGEVGIIKNIETEGRIALVKCGDKEVLINFKGIEKIEEKIEMSDIKPSIYDLEEEEIMEAISKSERIVNQYFGTIEQIMNENKVCSFEEAEKNLGVREAIILKNTSFQELLKHFLTQIREEKNFAKLTNMQTK